MRWEYDKDSTVNEHQDCGWVDKVAFTGSISNQHYGVYLTNSNTNTIQGNNITRTLGYGVYLYDSSDTTLSNNNIAKNNNDAIRLHNADLTVIESNTLYNNDGTGVESKNSSSMIVQNNQIDSNNGHGIYIENPNYRSYVINSSHPYGNNTNKTWTINVTAWLGYQPDSVRLHFDRIDIEEGDYLYVKNEANEIVKTYTDYHSTAPSPTNWMKGGLIHLNLVTNGSGTAWGFETDTYEFAPVLSNSRITGNNITGNGNQGVYLTYASQTNITTNNISANSAHGMYVGYSDACVIEENTIADNGGPGIESTESTSLTVRDNEITSNDDAGTFIYHADTQAYVIESEHPYDNNTNKTWTINVTAWLGYQPDSVRLHFNFIQIEAGDYLYVKDKTGKIVKNYTDENRGGTWTPLLRKGIIHLNLVTNGSGTNQGFKTDEYQFTPVLKGKNVIVSNHFTANQRGISLAYTGNNEITNNTITGSNNMGIRLFEAHKNSINNNTIVESTWSGMYLSYSDENILTENTIANSSSLSGMYLEFTEDNQIRNNTLITNVESGIHLVSSNATLLRNNTIQNATKYGIYLKTSNHTWIEGNTIADNGDAGVYLWKSNNTNLISNDLINNLDGISLENANENVISGNTISNNTDIGVSLSDSIQTHINGNTLSFHKEGISLDSSYYNTLSNNTFLNHTYWAISLGDSYNNTLSGNTIMYSKDGIYLTSSYNNTIISNEINSNKRFGVYLQSSHNNTIAGNSITEGKYGVYLLTSQNNSLLGNSISNHKYGVYIEASVKDLLTGNSITSNTWHGIYLFDASYHVIKDNEVSNNGKVGIYLYDASNQNIIQNNEVSGNGETGVYLAYEPTSSPSTPANNWIEGNVITENRLGIQVEPSFENIYVVPTLNITIMDNTIASNGDGLGLEYVGYSSITGNTFARNAGKGVYCYSSTHNTFKENVFLLNGYYGIFLETSTRQNLIYYNDFIVNSVNARDESGENNFNNLTIGNYWSDYRGKDVDGDGIGDTPHPLAGRGESQDNLPITEAIFTGDSTPPSVTFFSPEEEETILSEEVTVEWRGQDNDTGIAWYEIRIDGGSWTYVDTSLSYKFTELSDGSHTVDVRAVNGIHNSSTFSLSFTVNTSPIGGPGLFEEGAIVIGVAVIVGLVYYFKKVRKEE